MSEPSISTEQLARVETAAKQTWNKYYASRLPWDEVHPDARKEWIEVFSLFLNFIQERPKTQPPGYGDIPDC